MPHEAPRSFPSMTVVSCMILAAAAATPLRPAAAAESATSVAPRELVKAVNQLASTDIPLAPAQSMPCTLEKLPGSLARILPLLPPDHRTLIHDCAHGRLRLERAVEAFDLVAMIADPADRPAAVAKIRAFFDGRAVDVVVGRGLSDEPYPLSFDWAVVLDSRSGRLFSFVLNCHD